MEYHLVSSAATLDNFEEWIKERNQHTAATLIYLKDELDIGPLSDPNSSFTSLRREFWDYLSSCKISPPKHDLDDLNNIMAILNKAQAEIDIKIYYWIQGVSFHWMNYYWLLHWLHPIPNQLYTINTVGLPFLNDEQQLFFPNNWEGIPMKELNKSFLLARKVSTSIWEIEREEFKQLILNQHYIRWCTPQGKIEKDSLAHLRSKVLEQAKMANFQHLTPLRKKQFKEKLNLPPINKKLIELWLYEFYEQNISDL